MTPAGDKSRGGRQPKGLGPAARGGRQNKGQAAAARSGRKPPRPSKPTPLTKRQIADRAKRNGQLARAVTSWLAAAGIDADETGTGITVNGHEVHFTGSDRRDRDDEVAIDRIVGLVAVDALLERTKTELGGQGLPLRALTRNGAVRLYSPERVVAVIHATSAAVGNHTRRVRGNFLVAGDHWNLVRTRLAAAHLETAHPVKVEPRSQPAAVEAPPEVRAQFPADGPDALRARAVTASSRLRNERTVEFGHTVVLRFAGQTLRFRPIPDSGPPRVPFTYEQGSERLEGALRLRAPGDPMAIEAPVGVHDQLLADAWANALAGYAELTCVPGATPTISARFTPTRATHRLLASYVIGHIRHLGDGSASEAAHAHAQRIGIRLGQHQTWVRPHTRGVPPDAELVFDWETGAETVGGIGRRA